MCLCITSVYNFFLNRTALQLFKCLLLCTSNIFRYLEKLRNATIRWVICTYCRLIFWLRLNIECELVNCTVSYDILFFLGCSSPKKKSPSAFTWWNHGKVEKYLNQSNLKLYQGNVVFYLLVKNLFKYAFGNSLQPFSIIYLPFSYSYCNNKNWSIEPLFHEIHKEDRMSEALCIEYEMGLTNKQILKTNTDNSCCAYSYLLQDFGTKEWNGAFGILRVSLFWWCTVWSQTHTSK